MIPVYILIASFLFYAGRNVLFAAESWNLNICVLLGVIMILFFAFQTKRESLKEIQLDKDERPTFYENCKRNG